MGVLLGNVSSMYVSYAFLCRIFSSALQSWNELYSSSDMCSVVSIGTMPREDTGGEQNLGCSMAILCTELPCWYHLKMDLKVLASIRS